MVITVGVCPLEYIPTLDNDLASLLKKFELLGWVILDLVEHLHFLFNNLHLGNLKLSEFNSFVLLGKNRQTI